MPRAIVMVIDSFGIGGAPDAAAYGDAGADTFGHIAERCAGGQADLAGVRQGPLHLPNLDALGLGAAHFAATGRLAPGFSRSPARGRAACGIERSMGKDTPSGHWEIAGCPVPFRWGYFPMTVPAFPPDLTAAIIREAGLPGILGDCHASGTEIIERLGEESIRSGKPILYTSADSVLQIAAHEGHFGLERLYALCRTVRRLVDPLTIGRVIARPFVGETSHSFRRTANRKDLAIPPPDGTMLDRAAAAGREIVTVGKIGDIFAHRNTGSIAKGRNNAEHLALTVERLAHLGDGGLIFANLVDLDTEFGHRRDVAGYAAGLEAIDRDLPILLAALGPGDLLVITADHGNDPTWTGTDHTRECVPILLAGDRVEARSLGRRDSFADIAATVCAHLQLPAPTAGEAMPLGAPAGGTT